MLYTLYKPKAGEKLFFSLFSNNYWGSWNKFKNKFLKLFVYKIIEQRYANDRLKSTWFWVLTIMSTDVSDVFFQNTKAG